MHSRQAADAITLSYLLSLNAMNIISRDNGFVNPLSHNSLLQQQLVAQLGRVHTDAGAHGGSHGAGLDILTLCSGGLCLDDGAHQRVVIPL